MTALKLSLRALEPHERGVRAHIRSILDDVDELLDALRGRTGNLRPPELDDLGLIPALRRLARRQSDAWRVAVDMDPAVPGDSFGDATDTTCYRIAQEAIQNALRHGDAKRILVRVELSGDGR